MKKIIIALILILAVSATTEAHRYGHRHTRISVQTFYDELAPFGDWIYSPDYGYVWRPYFDYPENFRPYSSRGNWVFTEYGWTWASDYPWGWATFHYGRWYFDDYMGWMWIPGYEWAPAWVTWGAYDDFWGWAPLGPSINVSINFNWFAPDPWWTFVPRRHFCAHDWNYYIYDRPVVVNNITYITNVYTDKNRKNGSWFYGPRANEVERHSQTKVRPVRVVDNDRPDNLRGGKEQLRVYRPEVTNDRNSNRPAQVRTIENERNSNKVIRQSARTNDPGNNRTRTIDNDRYDRDNGMTRDRNEIDRVKTPAGNERGRNKANPQPDSNPSMERKNKNEKQGEIRNEAPSRRETINNNSKTNEKPRNKQVTAPTSENKSSGSSRIEEKTNKNGERKNSRKENTKSDLSSNRSSAVENNKRR